MQRYKVLYLKQPLSVINQREFETPWFYSRERAHQARDVLARKYGERNAVIFVD